jgi:CubicO group peptidase (beta-lactamase class C family)
MKKLILLILLIPSLCFSQSVIESGFIDSLINASMDRFPQAGIAVAVIEQGNVKHLKGYGITSVKTKNKVDEHTLFCIASNSKAFTTTTLGILVDQGKLSWNDRVITHIPEFKMYDSYVTENFTILDLLTHRSGLGLGAGDLMFYPDGSNFTIEDVLRSFQFLTPVSDFRTKYDYDNQLYIVAGEVIKRVSGKPWDQFVEDEIMNKLGMNNSVGIYQNITQNTNVAAPHSSENQKIEQLETFLESDGSLAAAGGIYASASDMIKWVTMHLNGGLYGENLTDTLISPMNHQELWKIHTNIAYDVFGTGLYNTHYRGYGLGFVLRDESGHTIVQHSGGVPGMLSMVTMIPELKAGIIVLTNAYPGGLSYVTITNEIKDEILGHAGMDWLKWADERLNSSSSEADSVVSAVWGKVEKNKSITPNLKRFTGTYKDNWFGEVEIYEQDNQLWMQSKKSPKLTGTMHYYYANTFVVAWKYSQDSGADNYDAFAMFQLDENGDATSVKMKGISPSIDFSYDFQDLDLKKVN